VFYAYIYLLYKDVKATKGAFTFAPSTGAKVLFYCIGGILGLVCLFALPFAIVFTSLNTARTHARDAERISDIQQIQLQLELHVVDAYPATLDALAADPSVPPMPVDPSTHMPYDYTPNSTDTAYTLCTTLESTPVPKCVEGSITPPSQATSTPVLR
jgi:hypothetical protein